MARSSSSVGAWARAEAKLVRGPLLGVIAAVALTTASCGNDDGGRPAPPATAPIRLPGTVDDACRQAAAAVAARVLCPPSGGRPPALVEVRHGDLAPEPCAYLVNLDTRRRDPRDARPFHVLIGGSCEPFALSADSGRWAVDPPASLRLVSSPPLVLGQPPRLTRPYVLARRRVRGHPALLLRSDPFPEGGLHGGHYTLVWNEDGRGYAVGVHYASGDRTRAPRPDQIAALARLATSMRRVSG